ncbi:MAG: substrate-binding domain-containing protein [Clostridia bacterium]|nr:substrate-binding domain-containing protein [Clostridia bacterium]
MRNNWKRFAACLLIFVLSLLSLTGCQLASGGADPTQNPATQAPAPTEAPTPEPDDAFVFTRENFPRMDGSTSMVPMAEAVASVLLGESREAVADLVHFNRTTQSFRNLMNGLCDILLVGEPNPSVFDEMKEAGFEYDMEEVANEALIFVVNKDNPINNLTTEQIRGIYSGKITNWKEVGGNDAPIQAFQRNTGAGSQALMEKLVMKDLEMAKAPEEYVITSMGELMEAVKNYDNQADAIGYSVYYYANDMKMADGLKIISVDGVEPSDETIRSGKYPHTNAYYCVIPKKAAKDDPNRILYDWIVSPDGQKLVAGEGYVSIMDK